MKIAASNIGWTKEFDNEMYAWMAENGVTGLEIAPTRIFPELPYKHLKEAKVWSEQLRDGYGLVVPSMQSIWYGRQENIFASQEEREILLEYTKEAINFAEAIECGNLVFGCPRNRNMPENADVLVAEEFFGILGEYAYEHGTVLAMEANPPMYNTNFCNTTQEAIELIKKVDSEGFKLNLDIGTMVANQEQVDVVNEYVDLVNHVHFSEPGLAMLEKRDLHNEIVNYLKVIQYNKFVSLEIKCQDDIAKVKEKILYIKKCVRNLKNI